MLGNGVRVQEAAGEWRDDGVQSRTGAQQVLI